MSYAMETQESNKTTRHILTSDNILQGRNEPMSLKCSSCGSTELDIYVCPECGETHRIKCRKCGFEIDPRKAKAG